MRSKLRITVSLFLICMAFTASGQKMVNSPFSRFNLGTIEPAGPFRSIGMGGLSIALRDNTSILFANPASYSSLDTNSFIFDFGFDYTISKLSQGGVTYQSDDINFDHLIMGFPLSRRIGLAVGIVPYSNGYYNISEEVESPVAGISAHKGEGSLTNFFLGSGFSITKNLSAGINFTLLFGNLRRTNQFTFDDFYNAYHDNSTERLQVRGINFDYGLQYSIPLKNKRFFNTGLSLTGGKHYNADYENLVFRYTVFGTTDTLSYTSDNARSAFIPATLRAGIAYGKTDKFVAGADFIMTNWSSSDIPGSEGYTANTKTIILGLEFTPDRFSNFSFIRRMDYRLGAHFGDNYLKINGRQIKEIGASFGIGIPLRRTLSKTNLFVDLTRKTGSEISGLHYENYLTMGISLNLYDQWFVKRKYD